MTDKSKQGEGKKVERVEPGDSFTALFLGSGFTVASFMAVLGMYEEYQQAAPVEITANIFVFLSIAAFMFGMFFLKRYFKNDGL